MLVINGRWVTGFWLGYSESSLWSKWELEVLCYSCGLELLLDSEICSYEVLDLALHMAGSSSFFMRLLKHYFLDYCLKWTSPSYSPSWDLWTQLPPRVRKSKTNWARNLSNQNGQLLLYSDHLCSCGNLGPVWPVLIFKRSQKCGIYIKSPEFRCWSKFFQEITMQAESGPLASSL